MTASGSDADLSEVLQYHSWRFLLFTLLNSNYSLILGQREREKWLNNGARWTTQGRNVSSAECFRWEEKGGDGCPDPRRNLISPINLRIRSRALKDVDMLTSKRQTPCDHSFLGWTETVIFNIRGTWGGWQLRWKGAEMPLTGRTGRRCLRFQSESMNLKNLN